MKTILILLTALSTAYGFDEQEKETIRKTFPAATRLDVDNVHGSIHDMMSLLIEISSTSALSRPTQ